MRYLLISNFMSIVSQCLSFNLINTHINTDNSDHNKKLIFLGCSLAKTAENLVYNHV